MENNWNGDDYKTVSNANEKEMDASIKLKLLKSYLIAGAVVIFVALIAAIAIMTQKKKIDALGQTIEEMLHQPGVTESVSAEINMDVINMEIKKIGELATMEYMYTNAARFSDAKQIKDWNIPFTEKSFILKWDGSIKAGIDVSKITTTLDKASRVLIVYLPRAEILSHETYAESIEVLDENDNVFNPIRIEDKVLFDAETKQAMELRAVENGLLEKAQKNAEQVIFRLLDANPGIERNYSIEFETD